MTHYVILLYGFLCDILHQNYLLASPGGLSMINIKERHKNLKYFKGKDILDNPWPRNINIFEDIDTLNILEIYKYWMIWA